MKTKTVLLYLPTQIRFPIGGERVTFHGLKLTREKRQLELSTRTRSGRAPRVDAQQICVPASVKQIVWLRLGEH